MKPAFCKICFDAGHTDYDTHNIRENGKITCKYLLSIQCTNCGLYGHTFKYCKSTHNDLTNSPSKSKHKIIKSPVKKSIDVLPTNNAFSALICCDDDDDINESCVIVENKPKVEFFWTDEIVWGKGFLNSTRGSWADYIE
tara:strand:+ start:185 stop:604 length:420 start_codon:yes stop_codon:yes gene_type:complete